MTITLNDTPRDLAAGTTLAALLAELGLAERKGLAVAINDEVAPRATWPNRVLNDRDHVLVIRATQGG